VRTASAGVFATPGVPAPWEVVQIAEEEDLDLSRHTAHPVTRAAFEEADLVLVMAPFHRQELQALFGHERGKIRLLSEFASGKRKGAEITDPFTRSVAHYRDSLEEIRESLEGLIPFLRGRF
jgi:protein-tyrosine-phosphatase